METTIVKCVNTLLSLPPEQLIDKDDWIVNSLVKGIASFSKICNLASQYRHKDYTEAKKEEIKFELAKVIFHSSCLVHLLDLEKDEFEVESLTEFSMELPEDYQEDVIMCAMNGITNFIHISSDKYGSFEEESADFSENVVFEADPVGGPEDDSEEVDLQDNFRTSIAEIFACVIILCQLIELDLEEVMSYTSRIEKP